MCVFAVTVFLWSAWMTDLSQEKEHPSRRSLLHWFRCRSPVHRPVSASCLQRMVAFQCADAFPVHETRWRLDKNTQLRLTPQEDQSLPPLRSYLGKSTRHPFLQKSIEASTVQRFTSPSEETQCLPPLPHLYLEPSSTLSILSARHRRPLHRSHPDQSTCGCPTAATVSPALPTPAAPSMECPSCCR